MRGVGTRSKILSTASNRTHASQGDTNPLGFSTIIYSTPNTFTRKTKKTVRLVGGEM
jgi:hypothetical protein